MGEQKLHGREAAAGDPEREGAETRAGESLLDLVQGLDAIVWEMDVATFGFTFVSQRAEELLGYPTRRWLEEPTFWQDVLLHPEDREWALEFREARDHAFEYRAVAADGRVLWLHNLVRVVRDGTGEPILLRGLMVDVTQRRRTQEALEERVRHAALAAEVGATVSEGGELRPMLQRCAEAIVRNLGAAFARVWTVDDAGEVLELQASAGMYTHLDGPHARVPVGAFKIGKIAEERRPHLTNDVPNDPRVSDKEWARREGMVAFAGYPLLVEGEVLGVVAMFARHELSDATLDALQVVADRLALALQRRRTESELRMREVGLAREQALRLRAEAEESRASFLAEAGTLLSSSLDYETTLAHLAQLSVARIADWCAIDIVEPDGELHRLVIAHPDPAKEAIAWELHRRHPPDHSLEHGVGAVLRSGQPELVADVPAGLLEQTAVDAEHLRILRELRLRSYMIVPLVVGGETIGAITFVSESEEERYDASDLRLARELANRAAMAVQNARLYRAAEQARSQVTRILSSISDAFFALDEEWRFTYLNVQAEELLQRPREELIGTSIWEAFPEASGSTFERMYRQAVREGRTVRFEELFAPLEVWFEVQAYPSDGGLSVYFRNVTGQRRAREALRYGELRYRSLVEATATIAWNTPASGEFGGEQRGWSAFTGQGPQEYAGLGWLEAIHPEDRAHTAEAWARALQSRTMYEVEHRVRRHDGEYRHMLVRAVPILTEEDGIREWVGTHTDVTPLRRAQEALEHQSYVTRTITENATPALFMMDERGHCTYLNPAAEAMTGFSLEEIREVPLHDAIHHHRPDGRPYPMHECPIDRALPEDFSVRAHEDVFIRRDGTFFPVVCAASPIFGKDGRPVGTVVEVRDVTGERAAEAERERLIQALDAERRRLREIFQEAPAFIATLRGPDHLFEIANPSYLQLVGHRDILGRTVREALPEVVEQGFIDLLDRVYGSGEPFVGMEMPVLLQREAGGESVQVYVNFVYQPVTDAFGSVSGIFVHGVEVTEMVQARQEVERKAEELARLARQLEATNRELDQFAYVASHDLKAPLRGIANLSQWIEEDLEGEINPEVREHLELLRGRVNRMEGLIDGILQYSRAGRVREDPEPVDLGELLRETVDLLSPPEEVRVEVAAGMPTIRAERLPLQQVFLNLLGNAIKYNRQEGPRVEIDVREAGDFLEFAVADNGPGIAAEYHERIFGIFQTLAARDKVEGTGIGLSLVKKMVENRGGQVWVESREGEGATFRFLWPRQS